MLRLKINSNPYKIIAIFVPTGPLVIKKLIIKKIILLLALFSVYLSALGQFNIWEVNQSLVKIDKKLYASRCEGTNENNKRRR